MHAYTEPGDVVLDPFAGFGTTLRIAENLGREPIGFEILPDRARYAQSQMQNPAAVRIGDVRDADWDELPKVHFSLSSPPYMTADDHPQNPLTGYRTLDGDYARYLQDLQAVYARMAARACRPDARIVVNVANLSSTRLAWDIGRALSEVLNFEREIVIDWDMPRDWFTQDYCIVFRARATE